MFSKIIYVKSFHFLSVVELVNHKTKKRSKHVGCKCYYCHPFVNQILKKNRELKMAAELGRKMLEENDGLRGMYNELEHEHEKTVKVRKLA